MRTPSITLSLIPLLLAGASVQARPQHHAGTAAALYPRGMVSAADPRGAEAGAAILRQGGNAADAAMATLLALNVVEPQSSGIGGGGYAVIDDGKGHITTIDGRETAPMAATGEWFYVNGQPLGIAQAIPGGRSVGIPGNVALMATMHSQFGRLPWRALFAPAIRLARDGFAVTPRLHNFLGRFAVTGALSPEARALYYQPDGTPLPEGAIVHDPALARFLQELAVRGPVAFYTGANARAIAETVSTAPRNPAPLTTADLAGYHAKLRPPVCASYRHYRLCGMGPSSSGATTVFGILGLLERFDLHALGKDNPVSWHIIAEAMRLTYADRDRYLADSDFADVPVAGLLSTAYLAARSQLIAVDHTMPTVTAGTPPGAPLARADTLTVDVPSTSHFVAIDRRGEVVSITSTIESPFGSGLMVNGYYLNNELTDFSLVPQQGGRTVANRVEPGKRPRSAMSPTLVYAPDGHLRLAIGAAGGATIPAQVVRAIIGVIDWNLSAQAAIALPVIFAPGGNTVIIEQGTTVAAMAPALKALGHDDIQLREGIYKANAVEVVNGVLAGAADPRGEGRAVGQ
ncbi:MAG: gamma-glutamyltransferase [Pseudomonadota bacterium]|nr:gamma-glutamyltransferase [Pseudomonadota bacterium]